MNELQDFMSCATISDEMIIGLADKYCVGSWTIESIAMDCADATSDKCTKEYLYNKYQGDCAAVAHWFKSYVIDCIEEKLEREGTL